MAIGDVRTTNTTTNVVTWTALNSAVVGDTVAVLATHRSAAQATTDPISIGNITVPTIHAEETEIGNSSARRAIYLCGLVVTSTEFDDWVTNSNRVLSISWDADPARVAAAWLIEGEFDLGTLQVAVDDSGAGQASSLSPGPLTPGGADALALAGLVIRHGGPGAVAYTDSFADALQDNDGSGVNGLTGAGALRLASASISTTASWATAEESTALLAVVDQPGGPAAFAPDGLTLATTVDAATGAATGEFAPDGATAATTVDSATFAVTGAFAGDGIDTPTTVDAATFTDPAADFAPDGITLATTTVDATYTATGTFDPDGVTADTTVDTATFTSPATIFAADPLTLATTVDDATFTATGEFGPDGLDTATVVDPAAFTVQPWQADGLDATTTVDAATFAAGGAFAATGLDLATRVDGAAFIDPTVPIVVDPDRLAVAPRAGRIAKAPRADRIAGG